MPRDSEPSDANDPVCPLGGFPDGSDDGPGFDLSAHWMLDAGVHFLNHGSFGAAPRRVLHEQQEIRDRMERGPLDFFVRQFPSQFNRARAELADFVGADPANLVFVSNATTGVNAVLRSLKFEPDDEILVTSHGYPACQHAVDFVAERAGASVVVADVPFPVTSAEAVVDAIVKRVSDHTRIAVIDHVTSATGLIFPVADIIEELDARRVDTLIDGAQGPGVVPLNLESLGATYYTGNAHKWLCAPRGAAFLWVDPTQHDRVRPTVISKGAGENTDGRFHAEFDWTGTRDVSPYLCVPTALTFLKSLMPGGWPSIYKRNHALAVRARHVLCEALDVEPPAPADMIGSMASVVLPEADYDTLQPPRFLDPLAERLSAEGFEVRIAGWPCLPHRLLRVSCQLYNTFGQYQALADALPDAL